MKQKDFVFNLCLLLFLNILIKPIWILGVDVGVQNRVGAASYGLYFSLFSFSLLFNMLLDMGTTNYNNRNIARNPQRLDKELSNYVFLRLLLGILYFVVVFVAAFILRYDNYQLKLLFWIAFNQFLSAFLLYVRSNISSLLMFKTDGVLSVLDKLLMIVFCGILLWGNVDNQQFKIEWFVWCQTVAYILTIILAMVIVLRKANLKSVTFNLGSLLQIIKKSFPYALVTFLMTCYYRIDSVMLERVLPTDIAAVQTGIYATAFRLLDALLIIAYLFSVILLPLFSKMLENKENVTSIVSTSFSLLTLFSVSAVVILFFYRNQVIQILYDDHIEESVNVFRFLIFGLIPLSYTYIFGTLLTANGSMKLLNIIASVGIIINVAMNAVLIPKLCAEGAAIASFCTQFLVSFAQFVLSLKIIGISIKDLPIAKATLFVLILVPIIWITSKHIGFHIVINLIVSVLIAAIIGIVTKLIDMSTILEMIKEGILDKNK